MTATVKTQGCQKSKEAQATDEKISHSTALLFGFGGVRKYGPGAFFRPANLGERSTGSRIKFAELIAGRSLGSQTKLAESLPGRSSGSQIKFAESIAGRSSGSRTTFTKSITAHSSTSWTKFAKSLAWCALGSRNETFLGDL